MHNVCTCTYICYTVQFMNGAVTCDSVLPLCDVLPEGDLTIWPQDVRVSSVLQLVQQVGNILFGTKLGVKETVWEGMDWIDLAHDECKWWADVNAVMNLPVA